MPSVAILGNPESWYVSDLQRAGQQRGWQLDRLDFPRLSSHICTSSEHATHVGLDGQLAPLNCDALIVRTMPPGSLEQVVFRMDLLQRLEARGVLIVNSPRSLECAVDKYLTTSRLAAVGLPVPPTVACETEESALLAFSDLGGDVVVKPLFGAEGRGILRVSDPDLALRTFRTLSRMQSVLYLQQFIDHPGYDVRVLVLDGQVVGGVRRSHPTDFRTNLSRQGTAEVHRVSPKEVELALAATDVTGASIAGVDLLYDRAGNCYVIEVNAVPGWQGFSRTTGIDVAELLLASIARRLS